MLQRQAAILGHLIHIKKPLTCPMTWNVQSTAPLRRWREVRGVSAGVWLAGKLEAEAGARAWLVGELDAEAAAGVRLEDAGAG